MMLGKTLQNLKKTKESFFNMERGTLVNIDLLKRGIMVYYHGNFDDYDTTFKLKDIKPHPISYPFKFLVINIPYESVDFSPYVMIETDVDDEIKDWIIKLCN